MYYHSTYMYYHSTYRYKAKIENNLARTNTKYTTVIAKTKNKYCLRKQGPSKRTIMKAL